jgi:hypothetical protein
MSYYGTWKSSQYGTFFASGEAWVTINEGGQSADFTLRYKGSYQHGLVRKLEMSIRGQQGSANGVLFQLKGAHDQQISFSAERWTADEIKGGYSCSNPSDSGSFHLHASEPGSMQAPAPRPGAGGCTIL